VDYPHLRNAPIREAIIDIRCQLPESTTLQTIRSLYDGIRESYPEMRERRRFEGQISLDEKGLGSMQGRDDIDGFFFFAKTQVVQCRLDGFAFSRLRPYETWETVSAEARRLWALYRDAANPVSTTRVALRYINEFKIPLASGAWTEYLVSPPTPPPDSQSPLPSELLYRYLQQDPTEAKALVTLALPPASTPDSRVLLIDIDVFKEAVFLDDTTIWNTLELLRRVKNRIFYSTITKKAVQLCQ
jgi:uncharacterized protein (TIGR04255 family)